MSVVEGGYDEDFVDLPSEHLKCVICCHVLKDPVQIMRCGHRYCAICFNQILTFSQHLKSPLICPVDREEVDASQVFNDVGAARMVGDLRVKCSFHKEGCQWVGELRCLDAHKTLCTHKIPATVDKPIEDTALLVRELSNRMERCEEVLDEKEKDISHLNLLLQQTNDKIVEKDKEIGCLKEKADVLEKEIVSLKETNKTYQEKISSTMHKCESYYMDSTKELKQLDKRVENMQRIKDDEYSSLKDDVGEMKKKLRKIETSENAALREGTSCKEDIKRLDEQLQVLETDCQKVKTLMEGLQNKTATVDKSFCDIKSQVSANEAAKIKTRASVLELSDELDILYGQELYVDTLFRVNQPPLRSTRFTWRIDGFKKRWEARKKFESPKFYCLPDGHLCLLYCQFDEPDSKDMGLYFGLCRGRKVTTADFKATILFALMFNNGGTKHSTITLDEVETHRDDVFTLKDGEDRAAGFGPTYFFEESRYDEFVKSDKCVVICTVTPVT